MSKLKKLIIFSLILFVSCGETPKKEQTEISESSKVEGVWERRGTIQYINSKPIDTVFYGIDDTGEVEGFRNVKIYSEGNIFWLNNSPSNTPWKGGPGGYGKYKIEKDQMVEYMSHGTGGMGDYLNYVKDSTGLNSIRFPFDYSVSEKNYVQIGGRVPNSSDNIRYGEFYEKLPFMKNSKLDGVWKRAYEISYVNGVAIDTTSVPKDALLDIKVIKDGYFIWQVDNTKLINDQSKPNYGGNGGFGQIDVSNENIVEYTEFGSGTITNNNDPRTNPHYAKLIFYDDDDLFQQITKDTLNQNFAGRGVVYRRVK